jgi:hypothetical protein
MQQKLMELSRPIESRQLIEMLNQHTLYISTKTLVPEVLQ